MLTQGRANLELLFLCFERYSCGRSIFLLHPTAVQLNTIFSKLRLSVQDRKIVSVSYCFKFKKAQKVEKEDSCTMTLYEMEKKPQNCIHLLQFPSTSPNRSKCPKEGVLTLFSLIGFSARKLFQTFSLNFPFLLHFNSEYLLFVSPTFILLKQLQIAKHLFKPNSNYSAILKISLSVKSFQERNNLH